jgi:flagella basal body P-ring formation protein FlgA
MQLVRRHQFTHTSLNIIVKLSIILTICISSTSAQSTTGLDLLIDSARQALQQHWQNADGRIEIDIASMDARVQVPECENPLNATINQAGQHNNGGRVTVRVECQGQSPWSRHVAATVRIYRPVTVARHALARGAVISAADLMTEEREVSQLRGAVLQVPEQASGQSLRRPVNSGTVLTMDMLTPPILVKRGDTVVLTAVRGTVAIRQTGTAMQDGEAGRQIQVRNNSSNRMVRAVVTGAGAAEVVF